MGLVVPAWVEENQERDRWIDGQIMLGLYWSQVLQEHDERLSVVFISENAHAIAVEDGVTYKVDIPGIVPGRWHVRCRNVPPFADTYMPITTPEGDYREPDSQVVEEVKRRSMDNKTVSEIIDDRKAAERAMERQRELQREQMKDEVADHMRAALRVPGEAGMEKRRWGQS